MTSMIFKDNEIIREITQKEHHQVLIERFLGGPFPPFMHLHLCKSSVSPGSYHNQVRATRGYTHLTTRYLLPGLLIASDLYLPSRQPSTSSHNTPHLKAPLTAFHSLARAQQSWILRPTEPFFLWSYFLPDSIFQISLLLTNSALYLLTLGILYFPLHFGKLFKNYTQPNLPQWQKKKKKSSQNYYSII